MPPSATEINEFLFRLLDNEISDGDFVRLRDWLYSDNAARRYYCRFMEDCSCLSLRRMTTIEEFEGAVLQDDALDESFWKLLSEEETHAPAVKLLAPEPQQKQEIIQKVRKERNVHRVNKASLLAAVVSVAALLTIMINVYLSGPVPYEVARVQDAIGAVWSSDIPLKPGTPVTTYSRPILLTQGVVKLVTDQNVEIVLEAPTEFRFVSYSEIALGYGKLFAHVPDQGRGFSVVTPNSKIVDLGTEFGVISQIDGNTEVYMYKGTANLFAGQKNENKISEQLTAGSAKKVDRIDSVIMEIALANNAVVRNIDSGTNFIWRGETLNLADLVGGGSGFGNGRLDRGIDPLTGRVIESLLRTDVYDGPKRYMPVSSNAYIDGIFTAGAEGSTTQINSAGLRTEAFPETSGKIWGYVFNGAWHESDNTARHHLMLNGVPLNGQKKTAITMHSNLGMTFDLAAIRKQLPSVQITAFSTTFGVSETVHETIGLRDFGDLEQTPEVVKIATERQSSAEFWVLLDGRNVLRQKVSSASAPKTVDIPIDDSVRFLTLAVTEADDTVMFDWGVFTRPELVLESAGP